jgi:hypothetical protein
MTISLQTHTLAPSTLKFGDLKLALGASEVRQQLRHVHVAGIFRDGSKIQYTSESRTVRLSNGLSRTCFFSDFRSARLDRFHIYIYIYIYI